MTQERFRVQKKAGSRLPAFLLAFALAASLLPVSASADVGEMNAMAAQFEENLEDAQEIMDEGGFLAPIGEVAVDSVAISNRAELEAIAGNLSGTYHLTADIDLAGTKWVPIGDGSTPFTGVFDGQGYKISNLTITGDSYQYNGLFGYVQDATIKNVGMVGTNINVSSSSGSYAGAIAGDASSTSSLTIENCYNTGDISSSSSASSSAGGIAGGASSIGNCYNTGKVSSSSSSNNISPSPYAGGIVGLVSSSGATIEDCYNVGVISIASTGSTSYAGGITSIAYSSTVIKVCGNKGDISSASHSEYSTDVGGIVGYAISTTIEQCYNAGAILSSASKSSNMGGIVGSAASTTIKWCYNTGDVSSNSSGYSNAGGVVGKTGLAGGVPYSIENCCNMGDIIANSTGEHSYAGGIAGDLLGTTSSSKFIANCYNTGAISSLSSVKESYAGGIAGTAISSTIEGCHNTGTILSSSLYTAYSFAGGVAGRSSSTAIGNCYNTGNISSSSFGSSPAGGIVAYASNTEIGNCYNAGNVSSSSQSTYKSSFASAGGILGFASSVDITISNCTVECGSITAMNAGSDFAYSYVIAYGEATRTNNRAKRDIAGEPVNDANNFIDDTITITPTSCTFTAAVYGYAEQTAQEFTITNIGDAELTNATAAVADGGDSSFEITVALSPTTIAVEGTATVSVRPKTGLAAGTHTDTLVIADGAGLSISASLSFTVSKAPLTITGVTATNRAYDGTTDVDLAGGALQGVVSGDESDVTFILGEGSVDTTAAANGKSVTTAITLTGDKSGNYKLAQPTDITVNITPISATNLTIESIPAQTYTGVAISPTLTVKDGDTPLIDTTDYTIAYTDNTNAGTATATITGVGNYTGTNSANFTINKKEITITGAELDAKIYDGTTTATVTGVTLDGVVEGDTLTLGEDYTATAVYNDANAATGSKTATVTVTLTGTAANNYTLTSSTFQLTGQTIARAPLTITAATLDAKTYDGTTAGTVASVTFSGATLTQNTDYTATAAYDSANAGTDKTATVTVTLLNGNYTLDENTFQLTAQTIGKATLTPPANALVYVKQNVETVFTLADLFPLPEGWTYEVDASAATSITINETSSTTKSVTLKNPNYSDVNATIDVTVTAKEIVAIAEEVPTLEKVYDGESVTYTGEYTGTFAPLAPTNAGDYTLTLTKDEDADNVYTPQIIRFTISPAPLTVTADSDTFVRGSKPSIPDYTATTTGFAASETWTTTPSVTTNATDPNELGTFDIIPHGGTLDTPGNYTISYENGTLTITKNNDATLSGLSLDGGIALAPTFDATVTSYTASVANSVTSVTVTAAPVDSNAAVTGDGAHMLNVGANALNIIITAEDGTTTKTYTITITRAGTSGGGITDGGGTTTTTPTPAPGAEEPEQPETPDETPAPEVVSQSTIETAPVKPDDTGKAAVTVETAKVTEAVAEAVKAVESAKAGGNTNAVAEIVIPVKVEAGEAGEAVKAVEAAIPAEAIKAIADAKDVILTVESEVSTITLDTATLATIADAAGTGETVTLTAAVVDITESLNSNQQAAVGDNPVIELNISVGDAEITDFGGVVTVSVPYTPKAGTVAEDYDLLTVYYLDDNGNIAEMTGASYDAATGQITFTTTHFSKFFIAEWINPFGDISKGEWYYKAARYAYLNGLITGVTDTTFSPQTSLTRAMLVTILARNAGIDTSGGETWYTKAVEWGIANGITDGTNPNGEITREQFATMLYRYAVQELRIENGEWRIANGDVSGYTDAGQISDWAYDAMQWAVGTGLITGRTATTLAPSGTATRAEAATLLKRYIESIG